MRCIAIVGGGPRGLAALEALYGSLASSCIQEPIRTLLFEETSRPGCGWVYDTKLTELNWLNIPERGLTIEERPKIELGDVVVPSFPGYQEWAGFNIGIESKNDVDHFPSRSKLGLYLYERYQSIANILQDSGLLTSIRGRIHQLKKMDNRFALLQESGSWHYADEVVLAIGYQATELSDQLQAWQQHAKNKQRIHLFTEAYPIERLPDVVDEKSIVALRGFGLAMIDVVRALTEGLGGTFSVCNEKTLEMEYKASSLTPKLIVPFSLDGLPMAPKPLNAGIDEWFEPIPERLETLRQQLSDAARNGAKIDDHSFLVEAIAPVAAEIYLNLGIHSYCHELKFEELKEIASAWLKDETFSQDLILDRDLLPEKSMKAFVTMATGTSPVSFDYCIGQVWRHCQHTLYNELSFSTLKPAVIADVVRLDERMKRYAFGPPVASTQQLLALISAGVMTLRVIDDPDIELVSEGWKFCTNGHSVIANTMINTVLATPTLRSVVTPIVKNLLVDSLLEPIHDDLGARTNKNGCALVSKQSENPPLAVLGRLSKGSSIGVDAILECFGSRIPQWAEAAVNRHKSETNKKIR